MKSFVAALLIMALIVTLAVAERHRAAVTSVLTDGTLRWSRDRESHDLSERVFRPYVRDVEVNDLGDSYIPLPKVRLDRRR